MNPRKNQLANVDYRATFSVKILLISCIYYFNLQCSSFLGLSPIHICSLVTGRLHHFVSMGEEKPDTLDFVKDFQEYLSQQTQHVNMISGSVSGVKEADELPPGN